MGDFQGQSVYLPEGTIVYHGMTMTMTISTGKYQWPCNRNQQEPIFGEVATIFEEAYLYQAYVREYPHTIFKIWKSHWKYGKYDWYTMVWHGIWLWPVFVTIVFGWFLLVFVTGIPGILRATECQGPPHGLELALRAILRRGLHRNSAAPVVQNHSLQRSGLSGPGRSEGESPEPHPENPVRTKSSRPSKSQIVYKSFWDLMIKDDLHDVSLSSEAKAYSCARDMRMHESYLNC